MNKNISMGLFMMNLLFCVSAVAAPAPQGGVAALMNQRLSYMKDVAGYKASHREIAMGAAVIEKAATATAQQIAAGAAVIGGVAALAAGEILTQATGIDAAIAATAVELGMANIAAQEDIVEAVGDTLAQAIPDKVEIADAEI